MPEMFYPASSCRVCTGLMVRTKNLAQPVVRMDYQDKGSVLVADGIPRS